MKESKIFIISLLVIIAGCTKKDDFKDNNKVPQIEFSKPDDPSRISTLEDTIKANGLYYINVFIEDEEHLTPVFTWNGDTIPEAQTMEDYPIHVSSVPNNDSTYEFQITEGGSYTIEVIAKDSYDAKWISAFQLFVITNMAPSINFSVVNSKLLDPLEITIDASGSFDPDSKWGGEIVNYEYVINNAHTITTTLSKISYIVDGPGNYLISVRAMDNDGAWSLVSSKYVTVTEN